jgi:hypothetical protein
MHRQDKKLVGESQSIHFSQSGVDAASVYGKP